MKLLVDQNISFRLLPHIRPSFPEASHVRDLGLMDANDFRIFQYAKANSFDAILTLDEDFHNIQLEHGTPPKIIWLRVGNCSTASLASIVLKNAGQILEFLDEPSLECLEIFG